MNKRLHRALLNAGHKDKLFTPAAYPFIFLGLEFCNQAYPDQELDAKLICEGLQLYAFNEFGRLTYHVLFEWGLRSTEDFGKIIFSLIDKGFLEADENDCPENFVNIYNFKEKFQLKTHTKSLIVPAHKKIDLFPTFP